MACGEFGPGRLPDPEVIWAEIAARFGIIADCEPRGSTGLVEALEPEPEVQPRGGGLGGLLSSLISRSTPKRSAVEIETTWEEAPEPVDIPPEPEPAPLAPAGPLLASKGKAAAAPPTDPDAINPRTVATLKEAGVEITNFHARHPPRSPASPRR